MRRLAFVVLASMACPVSLTVLAQESVGVGYDKYIDFVRAIASQTALAETQDKDAVKFLSLGAGASGEVVVIRIGLGKDHGSSFEPGPGARAIAHVHNHQMSVKPEAADFDALRLLKLRSFVISADGNQIWEIALVGGKEQYRAILPSGVGEWIDFRT
jgi:hypothetical protein